MNVKHLKSKQRYFSDWKLRDDDFQLFFEILQLIVQRNTFYNEGKPAEELLIKCGLLVEDMQEYFDSKRR